jgi:hypothetical protein
VEVKREPGYPTIRKKLTAVTIVLATMKSARIVTLELARLLALKKL